MSRVWHSVAGPSASGSHKDLQVLARDAHSSELDGKDPCLSSDDCWHHSVPAGSCMEDPGFLLAIGRRLLTE